MSNQRAFPSTWTVTTATGIKQEDHEAGMTLRDYFAGQALAAMANWAGSTCIDEGDIAARAYAIADAMLKARGG